MRCVRLLIACLQLFFSFSYARTHARAHTHTAKSCLRTTNCELKSAEEAENVEEEITYKMKAEEEETEEEEEEEEEEEKEKEKEGKMFVLEEAEAEHV